MSNPTTWMGTSRQASEWGVRPGINLNPPRLVLEAGTVLAFVVSILVANYALAAFPNVKPFDLMVAELVTPRLPGHQPVRKMDILAGNDRVAENITWKLTQFALGRPLAGPDVPTLKKIHAQSLKNGGKYTDTMTAIVLSDLVRMSQPNNTGSSRN